MKRGGLLIFGLLLSAFVFAQQATPAYIDVIKEFCNNYEPSEDLENYTTFAKKKKGWYVLQVNQLQNDRTLEERFFYSFSENKYLDLSKFYTVPDEVDIETQLGKFFNKNGSTYDWYAFERLPYYGYNGWYIDVIKDFAFQKNITDTLTDALGRAYANMANSFLWYQNGGMYPEYDTLHRKLDRLEYPSTARVTKVKEAIDNAILQFEKLNNINPSYKTPVGNSTLKLFNEYMHGYNLMMMCGNDELATQYINRTSLPEPYIVQAKNYLNSCDANAILFSYGDNDTYQLWYLQEKYNYRKDVLVINNSLLGLPVYVDMFKRKKMLTLTIPDSFLKYPENDVAYFLKDENATTSKKTIPLHQFLKIIYAKKYPSSSNQVGTYPTYPYTSASITYKMFSKNKPDSGIQKTIAFDLSQNYYFLNDIAVFDMVLNNLTRRPVYFTSTQNPFEKKLMQKGIIYKLILQNITAGAQNEFEVKGLEKYIADTYVPVLSNDSTLISYDGDNTFFELFYRVFNYYIEKKDTVNFKKWLFKIDALCPQINVTQINAAKSMIFYYVEAGNKNKAVLLAKLYMQWLHDVYTNPKSLTGYYFTGTYIDELTKLKDYLASKDINIRLLNELLK